MKKKEKGRTYNKNTGLKTYGMIIYLPKPVGAQNRKRHGEVGEGGDQMV